MTSTRKLVILTFLALAASSYAQSPRDDLRIMLAYLKKNPDSSHYLRKSILLARQIKPTPITPAEAQRASGKGMYTFKHATTTKDFVLAANQFKTARTLAPWVAEYHFNLALAYERADQISNARFSLENYLLADPNAADGSTVNGKIGALQAAEDGREQKAWKRNQADKQFVDSLEGRRWSCAEKNGESNNFVVQRGILYYTYGTTPPSEIVPLKGKEFPGWGTPISKMNGKACYEQTNRSVCGPSGWFSEDTTVITIPELFLPYDMGDHEIAARPMHCCQEFSCVLEP